MTYNINGVRSSCSKGLVDWLRTTNADFYCFQEVRAPEEVVESFLGLMSGLIGYHLIVNPGTRAGYAGTAILTKVKPEKVEFKLSNEVDAEGRTIILYYKGFAIVNGYVPNGGNNRVDYKLEYTRNLSDKLVELNGIGEVVLCSDINTAHTEQDLSHPKECGSRSSFLPIEREALSDMLDRGFCDALRYKHPEGQLYTWRSYKSRAALDKPSEFLGESPAFIAPKLNTGGGWVGWKFRFDYVLTSQGLKDKVKSAEIIEAEYSDHLPIVVELDI